ncbi:MAG: hydrogenobyrinic acid a,c-diamide synthase (glutamine-hydrolyzing) [Deltaproteobacteria bacterium]|nr:hydrogenobyrinic acid a,c-diamide synthase (glutamine-hydrolyzing) [Deltaproteobacteria bacterium]
MSSRILIAGLRGGSGKTIVSLGLIASCRRRGMRVAPFKKGPDFIDAGWLALAAGQPCHHLDPFLMSSQTILDSFHARTEPGALSVIEGNRGLYDGMDVQGSASTATVAKLLQVPVVLVVDCTKSTRTVAALVLGCQRLDPEVRIQGVILNRVGGARHKAIVSASIEAYCGLKVLGAIPRIKEAAMPERHMGLVPTPEHDRAVSAVEKAVEMAERHLDLDGILSLAEHAGPLPAGGGAIRDLFFKSDARDLSGFGGPGPRIGVIQDAAFQFYYPENLEALEVAGARLIRVSALHDEGLPSLDGLYIGGGFPETQAEALARNERFRKELASLAETGLPIYAECGGLMYLGRELVLKEGTFPMVGVLPVVFGFSKRPQGHGYTVLQVKRPNPYFEPGAEIRGHEFHYSTVLDWGGSPEDLAFRMVRGGGLDGAGDGLCYQNTLATYTHIHALGTPSWAGAMVEAARRWRAKK